MATLIHDPYTEERIRAQRAESGADRWDEVWEGVYVMNPLPNNEHQELANDLGAVLREIISLPKLGRVFPGVNVSANRDRWEHNYRCPDVAVFLKDGKAEDCDTFWYGGPDFAVEIVSPNDTVREKLAFYGQVGTRELLVVDRDPWQLELHRLAEGQLMLVGTSNLPESTWLMSESVPLRMRLVPGEKRPQIELQHVTDDTTWRL